MKKAIPDRGSLAKEYFERYEQYQEIVDWLQRDIETLLNRERICGIVRARIKSFESYYQKLLRKCENYENTSVCRSINDLLGLRVVCPFLDDLKAVECVLECNYSILQIERKGNGHNFREFGYESTHLLLNVPELMYTCYGFETPIVIEVQLRTILQDAWAEIEHQLVYKARAEDKLRLIRRKLAAINATLTLLDLDIQELRSVEEHTTAYCTR